MTFDCEGNSITIGSRVKLLRIDDRVLQLIPEKERNDIISMIDDVVDVYDIRGEFVCIEKSWSRGKGKVEHQMLSVSGNDLRLVSSKAGCKE